MPPVGIESTYTLNKTMASRQRTREYADLGLLRHSDDYAQLCAIMGKVWAGMTPLITSAKLHA